MDIQELRLGFFASANLGGNWQDSLRNITRYCKATAAVITLRSRKDARVVVSAPMAEQYHSPVIYGIDQAAVEFYISNLACDDPWSDCQVLHHPHVPTLMSDRLPFEALEKTAFWPWIYEQGINDSVVAEIGFSQNYWTALNVYFWNEGPEMGAEIKRRATNFIPQLKLAWQLGREVEQARAMKAALTDEVARHPGILILLDEEDRVLCLSENAHNLVEEGVITITKRGSHLSFCHNLDRGDLAKDVNHATHEAVDAGCQYRVVSVREPLVLQTGETVGLRTVCIMRVGESDILPWERPKLDHRERILIRTIAETGRVLDAQSTLQLSERQTRNIWKKAQVKVGGLSKQDLSQIYRNALNGPGRQKNG